MLSNLGIGDLVLVTSRQTLFSFGNMWDDSLVLEDHSNKMGLGIIVDVNPLFMNGKFKVWGSKARKFTREEGVSLVKIS